nr:MAG TPA: hypothetical protein [Caudoviricetes sp.]
MSIFQQIFNILENIQKLIDFFNHLEGFSLFFPHRKKPPFIEGLNYYLEL